MQGVHSYKACLRELHWLPVKERVEFKILAIVFKSLNGQGPNYFKDFFQTKQSGYSLRSTESSTITLNVHKTRTKFGDRTIMAAGPRLWNSLPQHVKQCQNLMAFRKSLKTHLFTRTFLKQLLQGVTPNINIFILFYDNFHVLQLILMYVSTNVCKAVQNICQ